MTRAEGTKMWNYLQRFPHYEELKSLNDKFLPELVKTEGQIEYFKDDIAK